MEERRSFTLRTPRPHDHLFFNLSGQTSWVKETILLFEHIILGGRVRHEANAVGNSFLFSVGGVHLGVNLMISFCKHII